jgi:hypothetical protein
MRLHSESIEGCIWWDRAALGEGRDGLTIRAIGSRRERFTAR